MSGAPRQRADAGTLFDAALLADPHGGYARLRAAAPVHRTTTPDGAPVWLVTRYQDVRAALADPRLSLDKRTAGSSGEHGASMPPELDAHLLNLDPPDHTRLRRLVATAFTPRTVEGLRPTIQACVAALLDRLAAPGADLMAQLAVPLALTVICDLLGIPDAGRPDFRRWTDTLRSPAPDAAKASRAAMGEMHGYLTALIAEKREHPADDLLTRLIAARDERERLSEPELVALAFLILFAGYDNSANLIGNALLALLTTPGAVADLRGGALEPEALLEETLRWNSPSMLASRRFAREDLQIAGVTIPAGERVWLSLVSANRDEARFAAPAEFRLDREGGHLGFGHGLHYCLGAALAKLEAQTSLTALVHRFPGLVLAGPAADPAAGLAWHGSFRNRGLRELPVVW
ncbi:cytochrome P450 [Kitasatospora sp. NBC_01287]|uniref:cytochrome P450 family protein n=1 Tax=Kitasatospora sp. NBC_01287 TaxID=2903573 RepID=UPI002250441E|nr:cytochrome P450 [Kitasatospora sp. NBC_01287]MCX4751554.1 cytochrome P450 [Kitasatospora sp. NBC_01287]